MGNFHYCKHEVALSQTPDMFYAAWGKPESEGTTGSQRFLVYNRDLAWRGVTIYLIVMIPLWLPVGHNQVTVYFDRKQFIGIVSEYGKMKASLCGFHSEGPNGFGCQKDLEGY